ncbi:hypothetical protein [Promicromonospora soli]|uniref:Uncharacterized protein n=1 Tax=Promicromonospora soli TaxID=2035533 RepID=A0A919G823_9MICO|nr:hypothetical protein [Promicromonospora soli]GHH79156.1 hypothetical protein GCM10017772_44230 [Promicromonospora soli]
MPKYLRRMIEGAPLVSLIFDSEESPRVPTWCFRLAERTFMVLVAPSGYSRSVVVVAAQGWDAHEAV